MPRYKRDLLVRLGGTILKNGIGVDIPDALTYQLLGRFSRALAKKSCADEPLQVCHYRLGCGDLHRHGLDLVRWTSHSRTEYSPDQDQLAPN